MKNLVKVSMNKDGEVSFSVSGEIKELHYDEMVSLREALCLSIAESEELYKKGQQ